MTLDKQGFTVDKVSCIDLSHGRKNRDEIKDGSNKK